MADRERSRSRSPRRDRERDRDRPRKQGGFKWKDNSRRDDRDERRGLERGYRNRSRSPRRNRDGDRDRDRNRNNDSYRPRDPGPRDSKPGASSSKDAPKPAKKEKPAPAPAAGGEEMIIVHVNDRLGTKAAIPCLASDPVKMFKILVAARVGREPHEILLKRQGERPFKDNLTLEDYGVSNGVQLDLEVDTGD
ncbi:ubiquitin-like protein [Colletotrichum tofieldiae]|uniref:Ubiquitin-like modifier HUB1 n=1 Tax=Colletotrichum tofieldiae TaxID=708197 RepID=A0A166XS89_9PEZI|nr:ubiquitin-like protein [Colletotrichum tofieldiae]GKT56291.1 ubiquitin-like protein [Colletotrichum tofieldiae]GKT76739.1 ubiquitin-like protein [Colletotrichum tofieldiae]GKT97390.1 ubiquitin-like protein [Colletotrichum tofieldiae]